MIAQRARLRNIAGQQIVERGNVSRALNAGVAAHRHDAAAGTADVAEQQLQNSRRANHLHARRVLRPTNCINDRAGPFTSGIFAERFRHPNDIVRAATANRGDHLRRVAREVSLQYLENAFWISQRRIAGRLRVLNEPGFLAPRFILNLRRSLSCRNICRLAFVVPALTLGFVLSFVSLIAAENAAEFIGIDEFIRYQGGRVRIRQNVFAEPAIVLDHVVN